MMSTMELNDLPDELLFAIFYHLPLRSLTDLVRLTLICHKWRRILWSKNIIERICSFEYQRRYITHRWPPFDGIRGNFLEFSNDSLGQCLTVDGQDPLKSKEDIEKCPLFNMTISWWCCTLTDSSPGDQTILLLWHFHLGYIGFYRDSFRNSAVVKCSYTQQHRLQTTFALALEEWYHVAIIITETNRLCLWINGSKINDWPLEVNKNMQPLLIAPYSSIWFASHCGSYTWHGSLGDICLWKRCLEPYELKEIARRKTTVDQIDYTTLVQL